MKFIFTAVFSLFISCIVTAQIKYVTATGAGIKDGNSWATAYSARQFADTSYTFTAGTQVWIAAGIYYPTKLSNGVTPPAGDAQVTFVLNRGVKFYGGFAGTETSINDRPVSSLHAQNQTILSADINTVGFNGDNSLYVIVARQCGGGELLDGLTIATALYTGVDIGFAISATPVVINNCIIRDNSPHGAAGGIVMTSNGVPGSSVDIFNSYFVSNFTSISFDGAILTVGCRLRTINCVFFNNGSQVLFSDEFHSSSIHFTNTSGEITGCTFYNNLVYGSAFNSSGTAILLTNVTDSIYINNSIFWKNLAEADVVNIDVQSGLNLSSVKNCIFQPQTLGTGAATLLNSVSTDPLFANSADYDGVDNFLGTVDDGFRLAAVSPCIDNGKNEFIPGFVTSDVVGNSRVKGCRVDIGAYEYENATYNTNGLYNGIGQSCTSFSVPVSGTSYIDSASCHIMTTVLPNGAQPLNGAVQVCVTNAATVPFYNGVPYVPRHYDIVPTVNAANATARITIYFTQQDFNNYNAAAPTAPQLPTGPADAAGIANIMIEQDHGISLTGVPGTYNGTTIYINPADNDIVWNAANNYWEISFDVTGFSGFFMTTLIVTPVELLNFSAKEQNGAVNLYWQTASEINADHFDVQKSNNGRDYYPIGNIPASGNINGSSYSMNDNQPFEGFNYYRLASVDINGTKKFSNIILLNIKHDGKTNIVIAPNPTHITASITISGNLKGKAIIDMYDLQGRKIHNLYSGQLNSNVFSITSDVSKLEKGIYIIAVTIGKEITRTKLVVQ